MATVRNKCLPWEKNAYRENGHRNQEEEKAQLLVGLFQGVDQRLQARKMSHQLKYSKERTT
jgi:hypothetical protein